MLADGYGDTRLVDLLLTNFGRVSSESPSLLLFFVLVGPKLSPLERRDDGPLAAERGSSLKGDGEKGGVRPVDDVLLLLPLMLLS